MKNLVVLLAFFCCFNSVAQLKNPRFRVLAFYENKGHHVDYSKRARAWLDSLAAANNFSVDFRLVPAFSDELLNRYQLVIQLDYAPYGWSEESQTAFKKYIEGGRGGWIGFHHATLLGDFDGYKMWPWFSDFMGGIEYKNYIASFAQGTVNVEAKRHPVMRGIPKSFTIAKDEWYTYNKSPRPNVQVLASVNEDSYAPQTDIKMGDHPVVWTNPHYKARNVYIFMGHSPELFDNEVYKKLFTNAIFGRRVTIKENNLTTKGTKKRSTKYTEHININKSLSALCG